MLAFTPASTTHQRNRAVLLPVVKEERTVRKPADKVIAPVLLDNPVILSHADIIPKARLLYQFYCINKLRPFIPLAYDSFQYADYCSGRTVVRISSPPLTSDLSSAV